MGLSERDRDRSEPMEVREGDLDLDEERITGEERITEEERIRNVVDLCCI